MDRREAVLRMRNEGLTWAEIGAAYGISRQRAHQIALPPKKMEERKEYLRRYMREWMRKRAAELSEEEKEPHRRYMREYMRSRRKRASI